MPGKEKFMRIGMIAPIPESIPPQKYGGTERVIYHLTEGLVKRGHEVTLFASGDSKTSAKLVSVVEKALRKTDTKDIYGFNTSSMLNIGVAYGMQDEFDVIHDHNPHLSLPTANIAKTPSVLTWHGPFSEEITKLFSALNKPYVVSISKSQGRPASEVNFLGNVYNGLELNHYPFNDKPQDYLLYVGRIDIEKGTHTAIDAAVALKKKLIIAAKVDLNVPHIRQYFVEEVEPRLKKHSDLVTYIGEVDEVERNDLMKNALCMLHPITFPEPFGLALIEAAACGCPVIAYALGSIPEVIVDGKTGYIVKDFSALLEAVGKIDRIKRIDCRAHVLSNFSADRMVEGYLKVYRQAIKLNSLKSGMKEDEPIKQKHHGIFSPFSDLYNQGVRN